jgi:hypothetical protein
MQQRHHDEGLEQGIGLVDRQRLPAWCGMEEGAGDENNKGMRNVPRK